MSEGSSDAEVALKHPGPLVIDLCHPIGKAEGRAPSTRLEPASARKPPPCRAIRPAVGQTSAFRLLPRPNISRRHRVHPDPAPKVCPRPGRRQVDVPISVIPHGTGRSSAPSPPRAPPDYSRSSCSCLDRQNPFRRRPIPRRNFQTLKKRLSAQKSNRKIRNWALVTKNAAATVPEPQGAAKTNEASTKVAQEARHRSLRSASPWTHSPASMPPPPRHPKAHVASSAPKPPVKRNAVLAFDLGEPGKAAPATRALDLEPFASEGDAVSALELIRLNKPAKDSDRFPHPASDAPAEKTLDVMISVRAGLLGREDQPLAHFKADGLKINFNWDPYATSDQVKESKNFLRQCILKVVIKNGEPLYSLLKSAPMIKKIHSRSATLWRPSHVPTGKKRRKWMSPGIVRITTNSNICMAS